MKYEAVTRPADGKGRLNIGAKYAGKKFEICEKSHGEIVLRPVEQILVLQREAWLFKNVKALQSVNRGIEDARGGRVRRDIRVKKDLKWLDEAEE